MQKLLEVIYQDAELLAVNKPAGLVCHPTKTDEYSSLISRARLYLGPGVRSQLVHRLDRETSGVTILALTDPSARELRRVWENRQVVKEYLTIVHGRVAATHGVIDAPLGKDESSKVAIKDCVRPDGAAASTEYWLEHVFRRPESDAAAGGEFSLVRVRPHTGRKHQIRIHLAHLGHPIVGDKIYGGDEDFYLALVENRLTPAQRRALILPHQALHASLVSFSWRGRAWVLRAEPEPWFTGFLSL